MDKFEVCKKIRVIISYYRDLIERKKLIFQKDNVIDVKVQIGKDLKEMFKSLGVEDWKMNFLVDEDNEQLRIQLLFEGNEVEYYLQFIWKDKLRTVLREANKVYMKHSCCDTLQAVCDVIQFLKQNKYLEAIDTFDVVMKSEERTDTVLIAVEKDNRKESMVLGDIIW